MFKPGELVAVYNNGSRYVGNVQQPTSGGNYLVNLKNTRFIGSLQVHPKQLRKLKPIPKPADFWIEAEMVKFFAKEIGFVSFDKPGNSKGWIRVKEVLE